jgi:TM2 domain
MAYKSKALATWLACVAGAFGTHRFYLHGTRDAWAWLHAAPTLAGLYGIHRMQTLGQDDHWSWLLLPLLGLMIAQACLFAIVYGLTPDAKWDQAHNPGRTPQHTRWLPVLGVITALMMGATALMATIAFGGQRFFEWQIEEAQKISRPSP